MKKKFCSNKYLCINPNQGNLTIEDYSKGGGVNGRKQCKFCQRQRIKLPPFDYVCLRKECINPNQGNLTAKDFNKRSKNICILCRKKYDSEYNKKEETINRIKIYLKTDKYYNNRYILNKYLINGEYFTRNDYRIIFDKQNKSCAICNLFFDKKDLKNIHIDHDHKTGEVRGILCSKCNHAIGLFNDNIDLLNNAINYLKE